MSGTGLTAPVYSTGGGGFQFEDEAAAFVLAAMLAGQPPLGADIGLVQRIDWQTSASGWRFDDLLLTCAGRDGPKVAVSCKAGNYVTRGGWPDDAVTRLWEQWTLQTQNPFRRGVDRLALITGCLAQEVDQAWDRLLQEAIATDTTRFLERLSAEGGFSEVARTLVGSLECPFPLRAGLADEPSQRLELLRSVRLWHKDLQRMDSNATGQALEWCRQSLAAGDRTTALTLHNHLRSAAADRRIRGGTLDLVDLVRTFVPQFSFKTWPDHEAAWQTLDARSRERTDTIGDAIGGVVCLPRIDVMRELVSASKPSTIVLLEGESGSGKSALAKRLAHRSTRTLWIDASDLEAATLSDVARALGVTLPLVDLLQQDRVPAGVLVIDGVEKLSAMGRRHAARLVSVAVQAARPWAVVLTGQLQDSSRVWTTLARALPESQSLRTVEVPLPDEQLIGSLIGDLPIRVTHDVSRSVVRALRNLKVLDLTATSTSSRDIARYPDLVAQVWDGFLGESDSAARSQVLKVIGEADAERVVGGVPPSTLRSVEEQRVAEGLVHDGLLTLRSGRLIFRHDLLGDWARLLLLVEAGEGVDNLLGRVGGNIRWGPALRLFAQWLAQRGASERRALGRLLAGRGAAAGIVSVTLLEGLLRSPDGGETLRDLLPELQKAEPAIRVQTLKTFLSVATSPNEFSQLLRRDHPTGAAVRARFRVPIPELWPGVVAALTPNAASLTEVCPVEVSDIARVWLADQVVASKPEFAETTALCSRLAVLAAKEVQARIAERGWGREDRHPRVFEALLLAAPWLPEEVAEVSLELAERRPAPPAVVARVEAVKRRGAAEIARRSAELTDEQKEAMRARRGSSLVQPTPKPRRQPLSAGPNRRVDEAFRHAVLQSGAVVRLAQHKPEVAQEVLLACCLQDPGQEDPLYSDFSLNDRAGTIHKLDWYPPLYLRGPWLPLLLQCPAEGLTAVLRLVEIATAEWLRLSVPPAGVTGHEDAQRRTKVTLEVDGQFRVFRGSAEVFGWYRGDAHAGNVVPSALMALEQWLYRRVDAKEAVDAAIGQILRTSSSVALLGVLAALARREPGLLRGCLQPLLRSWMLLSWDDELTVRAGVQPHMPAFGPFNVKALNGWIDDEAERWSKLPHRFVRLPWLVARALALGDKSLIQECGKCGERWQTEIDGGTCTAPEEVRRLMALLNPANLSVQNLNDGQMQTEVTWPPDLAAKYHDQEERSEPEIVAFRLRAMMRRALDDGTPLEADSAQRIWRVASGLQPSDISDGAEDVKASLVARVAASAALEALAPAWLDKFPDRRVWCERTVRAAVEQCPQRLSRAAGMSIYREYLEAFTGEWALARLALGDDRAEVRRILAEAMTANEYIVTGQILASAVRHAAKLADDVERLFNLMWLWAALRNLPPDWQADRAKGQKIAAGRRSKLIQAFVDRRIPNRAFAWSELSLRAARVRERYTRMQRASAPSWLANEAAVAEAASSSRTPLPGTWGDHENHGFNWSVLAQVVRLLPVELRPSFGPQLAPLVEFDQRLFDLIEFTIGHTPTDNTCDCSCPNSFESLVLGRTCMIMALHEDEQMVTDLWVRLVPLLAGRHHWCETFFGYWFQQPREDTKSAERFHRRWRMMIASASDCPTWGAASESPPYHLGKTWSALLGVDERGPGIGMEADRRHLGVLEHVYAKWAERYLADRWHLCSFCAFLRRPGAATLRLPALAWVESALRDLSGYLPTAADLVAEVVGYCVVVWYKHGDEVLEAKGPRTSLLAIVERLSELRAEAIHELKADIERSVAMLGER
jgi:hypothetical protein